MKKILFIRRTLYMPATAYFVFKIKYPPDEWSVI